jgi:hypothetical protein
MASVALSFRQYNLHDLDSVISTQSEIFGGSENFEFGGDRISRL